MTIRVAKLRGGQAAEMINSHRWCCRRLSTRNLSSCSFPAPLLRSRMWFQTDCRTELEPVNRICSRVSTQTASIEHRPFSSQCSNSFSKQTVGRVCSQSFHSRNRTLRGQSCSELQYRDFSSFMSNGGNLQVMNNARSIVAPTTIVSTTIVYLNPLMSKLPISDQKLSSGLLLNRQPCRCMSLDSFRRYSAPDFPPVALAQNLLETCHMWTALPWWAAIPLATCMLRSVVTLPLSIYTQHVLAKVQSLQTESRQLAGELQQEVAVAKHKFGWTDRQAKMHFAVNVCCRFRTASEMPVFWEFQEF